MTGHDDKEWQAILNAEPALAALFAPARQPRYLYFACDNWRYCWTTERMADGTFVAFVYRPVGKGSRSGTATTWRLAREVRFKTRKAAKARAIKWWEAAKAAARAKAASR